jgi:hypothetical protein
MTYKKKKGGSHELEGAIGMTSTMMMIGLVAFYVLTAGVSGWENNWPRVLYWLSAAGITVAVLWAQR